MSKKNEPLDGSTISAIEEEVQNKISEAFTGEPVEWAKGILGQAIKDTRNWAIIAAIIMFGIPTILAWREVLLITEKKTQFESRYIDAIGQVQDIEDILRELNIRVNDQSDAIDARVLEIEQSIGPIQETANSISTSVSVAATQIHDLFVILTPQPVDAQVLWLLDTCETTLHAEASVPITINYGAWAASEMTRVEDIANKMEIGLWVDNNQFHGYRQAPVRTQSMPPCADQNKQGFWVYYSVLIQPLPAGDHSASVNFVFIENINDGFSMAGHNPYREAGDHFVETYTIVIPE